MEVSALGVKEEYSNQRASPTDYSSFQQKIIETVSDSQVRCYGGGTGMYENMAPNLEKLP